MTIRAGMEEMVETPARAEPERIRVCHQDIGELSSTRV